MHYDNKFNQQAAFLFKGKHNITVRSTPLPKKTKKNPLKPSVQHQDSNQPSNGSIPNPQEAMMTSTLKKTHNLSCHSNSSGLQTEESMSFSDDEEWNIVPIKQNPKPKKSNTSNYKSQSLQEIRKLLSGLYDALEIKYSGYRFESINTRKKIEMDIYNLKQQIEPLQRESRLKEIQQIKENPHLINIHNGYRSRQIEEMLNLMTATLQSQFKKGNNRIIPQKRNRRWVTSLKMLTGKGLHSPKNKSTLKKQIQNWAQTKPGFDCVPQSDHILLYIPLIH